MNLIEKSYKSRMNNPPADLDAEQLILSSILHDNDAIIYTLELISPSDFFGKNNKELYSCMILLFEDCKTIEPIAILDRWEKASLPNSDEIKEYLSYLKQLSPSISAVQQYCKIVNQKSDLRKLLGIADHITDTVLNGKQETVDLLGQIMISLEEFNHSSKHQYIRHLSDHIDDAFKQIEHTMDVLEKGGNPFLPTGFNKLDALIGGIHRFGLFVVAGEEGIGKISLCINLVINLIKEKDISIMFFTLATSGNNLTTRILLTKAKMGSQKLREGPLDGSNWDRLTSAAARLCDTNIYIDDSPKLSVFGILWKIKKAKSENANLKVIIINYFQLIKTNSLGLKSADIAKTLRYLSIELDVFIILTYQLNHHEVLNRQDFSQFNSIEDSSIRQNADIVLFLSKMKRENEDNLVDFFLAKNPVGPTGNFQLFFNKKLGKFENLPLE
ncbi:MAG: hypothetical protein HQK84_10545 [Nitrospinae bacterium]|nr:hypothetical protein [Nitrospinota bacterium]